MQYLERPEIKPLWYDAVYGELAAKQLYARRNKTEMPTMRDSLWYGDGTKLNLFCKAVENGKTVVRSASVYEVIDAYSETFARLCGQRYGEFRRSVSGFPYGYRNSRTQTV